MPTSLRKSHSAWLTSQLPQRFLLQPELALGPLSLKFCLRATQSIHSYRNTRAACLDGSTWLAGPANAIHLEPPRLDRFETVSLVLVVLRPEELNRLVIEYFCAFADILNAPYSTGPKTVPCH